MLDLLKYYYIKLFRPERTDTRFIANIEKLLSNDIGHQMFITYLDQRYTIHIDYSTVCGYAFETFEIDIFESDKKLKFEIVSALNIPLDYSHQVWELLNRPDIKDSIITEWNNSYRRRKVYNKDIFDNTVIGYY